MPKKYINLPVSPEAAEKLNQGRKGGESWNTYLLCLFVLAMARLEWLRDTAVEIEEGGQDGTTDR